MRKIPASDFGLISVEDAAARRNVNERTIRAWITGDLLPVVVVGSGKRETYLLRAADVAALIPPRRGAPAGNRHAAKKEDAPAPTKTRARKVSGQKSEIR